MAYIAQANVTTGDLITAVRFNQDNANVIAIYAGAMSIASQATNDLPYFSSATQIGRIAAAASSVLVTSAGSVPSLSTTLPSGLAATNLTLTTPVLGTPQSGALTNCTSIPAAQLTGTITSATQDLITRTGTIISGAWNAGAVTSSGAFTSTLAAALVRLGGAVVGGWMSINGNVALEINRHPYTGTFDDSGKAHAAIRLFSANADSSIQFLTTTSNNTEGTVNMSLSKAGLLTVSTLLVGTSALKVHGATGGVSIGDTTDPGATHFRVAGSSYLIGGINGLSVVSATLSADQNNYAPTGYAAATIYLLSTNDGTARTITGLQGGVEGRVVVIKNDLGPGQINTAAESASSTAGNRFVEALNLSTTGAAMFIYTGSRWHWLGTL